MTSSSQSNIDNTKEIRFAVVMYGGVSLAIYINGVAQELYRLVLSTAAVEQDSTGTPAALAGKTISGTERVYRKLSHLVSDADLLTSYRNYVSEIEKHKQQLEKDEANPAIRKQMLAERIKAAGPDPLEEATSNNDTSVRTAFIVDILSGTSAGGINAIYLAKAFANDQKIDQLKDLWVNEGDIALLLNDKRSVMGLHMTNQVPPQSLLNSRRMYYKLLKSLTDMEKYRPSQDHFQSPYVDELDLFITTTDIAGVPVPLRLLDGVVYERRHRNVFHFKYGKAEVLGDDRNDFRAALNPFLAFAARCTSSFPFAFEPMRLCDIDEVVDLFGEYRSDLLCKSDSTEWQRFFQEELDPQNGTPVHPPRFARRPFGDGGYLDNKPFSYATETLAHRQSDVPVDRKLIYIEPSPEHPEDELTSIEKPNALQNVKAAILDLPTYETIREDLQRVLDRNQLIERVNRIISGIEEDVNNYIPNAVQEYLKGKAVREQKQSGGTGSGIQDDHDDDSPDWYSADLIDMVNHYSRYFLPYRRLRISSVTDDIAKLVARLANFDEDSDQFLAIRALVRTWREETYVDYRKDMTEEKTFTVNGFLSDYDLGYRLRRINATRNKVDQLTLRDERLLADVKKYADSLKEIETALQNSSDQPKQREAVNKKFPQIHLQKYGARLLAFTEKPSDEFNQVLRFVKCELNEVFKRLRAQGRLLRSRRAPNPKTDASSAAAEATVTNPLLPFIASIGITPSDLNEILGTVADGGASNRKAGPAAAQQEYDEDDYAARAEKLLTQPEKANVRKNLAATAAELKEQLSTVFRDARRQCNTLFDPEGVYTGKSAAAYQPISPRGKEMLRQNPDLISSEMAEAVRGFVGYYYHNFDDYDQIRFPIFYEADVGEADVVEVIRISPEDATSLINERQELKDSPDPSRARQKLAGVSLHHFGAFLDRTWRQNDIMWGRLDGVERLIAGILPGATNELVRQELIKEAHLAILKEELKPQALLRLEGVMSEALLRSSGGLTVDEALDKSLQPLKDAPVKSGIDEIVRLRLADDELVNFVGESYQVNRQLDAKLMLNSVSRATQIIGQMFEEMAEANGLEGKRLAWIARLGKIFWGLVEVAVPNSILHLLFTHWLKLLYLFEALMIIGGTATGKTQVQQFGFLAFALTLATNLAVFFLHDEMLGKRRRLKVVKIIVIVLGIFVFLIGVTALLGLVGVEPVWNRMYGLHEWVTRPSFWRRWWPAGLGVVLILIALRNDLKALWYGYTRWLTAFRGDKDTV